MKTRFFFLAMLISASCFATKYRVYAIRGTSQVKTSSGSILELTRVNQTFDCIDLQAAITPITKGAFVQVVEVRSGVTVITQVTTCNPRPCFTNATILGNKRREWDDFALKGGDFTLTQSLSHDLSTFSSINQKTGSQINTSKIHSTQMQKAKTPINQDAIKSKTLDKAVIRGQK